MMNDQERKELVYILALLRSSDGIFDISLGPEECSLLVKYIDYLRGVRGVRGDD